MREIRVKLGHSLKARASYHTSFCSRVSEQPKEMISNKNNMPFQYFAVFVVIFVCCSCAKAENVLDFVMIGDWGGKPDAPYYTRAEADIATQMGKKATEVGAKFTIALGDNFYDMGVKNVDDPRFKETFEVG